MSLLIKYFIFFFFQAEDGIRDLTVTGVQTCALPISIISTLKNRWYATAKDRRFQPTPQGEIVWQVLKRCFPDVFEVGFTAQMETELDKVEEGDLAWQQVLEDFWRSEERRVGKECRSRWSPDH